MGDDLGPTPHPEPSIPSALQPLSTHHRENPSMRRASRILLLLGSLLALSSLHAAAQNRPQVVTSVDGIGMIDYSRKPTFKVGDWVKYHMSGSSDLGMKDDYEVTVIIAGEEEFWGERCVWIETWTDAVDRSPRSTATLMSYSIFGDSLAIQRMQLYRRKSISSMDEQGRPRQEIVRAAASALKSRTLFKRPIQWDVDTLPPDTVVTPRGTFNATRVSIRQGTGATTTVKDSSIYTEARENRMSYMHRDIPITHIVREDVESIISRRTWEVGRSSASTELVIRDRGVGTARLVDFGSGLEARLVPEAFRRSLAEQKAAAARKPAVGKRSGG